MQQTIRARSFSVVAASAVAAVTLIASVSGTAAEPAQSEPIFATFDDREREANFVQTRAAIASGDKIAIIVWGGNQELQQQAYNGALDLRDAGIPLAFILGPDLNTLDVDADFQVYAQGLPMYEYNGATYGSAKVHLVRPAIVRMGTEIHSEKFNSQTVAVAP